MKTLHSLAAGLLPARSILARRVDHFVDFAEEDEHLFRVGAELPNHAHGRSFSLAGCFVSV